MSKREKVIETKYEEYLDELLDAIDELGIEEAVDNEMIEYIAYDKAESYVDGLEEDYADYQRELERERNM